MVVLVAGSGFSAHKGAPLDVGALEGMKRQLLEKFKNAGVEENGEVVVKTQTGVSAEELARRYGAEYQGSVSHPSLNLHLLKFKSLDDAVRAQLANDAGVTWVEHQTPHKRVLR
eukprot:CAMPEP_0119120314 /NCGR_PEP_ID=MMETSP1310-20130426/1405_1 /TAXON_ID=464262 /ORGANISM="Genus nov. species nov., Strain RCC2339" /LENGTH=113 /DNA_ID=CAMNT_0007109785 /DNA_START=190 /DNA_END=531 /DNA_ORIENTATION=-